jgi:hypothetical protein
MMTLGPGSGRYRLFPIVDTYPVPVGEGRGPARGLFASSRLRRNKEAGQAIVEFALTFSLFLILLLGGIDLAWDVNQKSNFNFVVTQAATCVATAGCDPNTLGPQTASGLGLNPAKLSLNVVTNGGATQVVGSYQGVSLTNFLPPISFSATVTATCVGCLNQPFR